MPPGKKIKVRASKSRALVVTAVMLGSALLVWWLLPGAPPSRSSSPRLREALAYPGFPGPTTAMRVVPVAASARRQSYYPSDLGSRPSPGQGPSPGEQLAPPASGLVGSQPGSDPALAESAALRPRAIYRFKVNSTRFKPGAGERLRIDMQTSKSGQLVARIYLGHGHASRVLAELLDPKGAIHFEWDGLLDGGAPAPAGAYLLSVEGPDKAEKVGITLVR